MSGDGVADGTPDVCQWLTTCPKLKTCKRDSVWTRYPPTKQERAAEAAIRKARREYGKIVGHAQRPLRIEREHETHHEAIPDSEIPY